MMNPLPSVSRTYAMITSDESQRMTADSKISRDMHESMALYAGRGNNLMMHSGKGKFGSSSQESLALYAGRGGHTNYANFYCSQYRKKRENAQLPN